MYFLNVFIGLIKFVYDFLTLRCDFSKNSPNFHDVLIFVVIISYTFSLHFLGIIKPV
jgi:hypothetical protein